MHWSAGLFGYFPTYSLGAMYACQIFQAAEKELPGLADDIAAGRFSRLREWLREKIHAVGSLHTSGDELMRAVTGAPLDPKASRAAGRAGQVAVQRCMPRCVAAPWLLF